MGHKYRSYVKVLNLTQGRNDYSVYVTYKISSKKYYVRATFRVVDLTQKIDHRTTLSLSLYIAVHLPNNVVSSLNDTSTSLKTVHNWFKFQHN